MVIAATASGGDCRSGGRARGAADPRPVRCGGGRPVVHTDAAAMPPPPPQLCLFRCCVVRTTRGALLSCGRLALRRVAIPRGRGCPTLPPRASCARLFSWTGAVVIVCQRVDRVVDIWEVSLTFFFGYWLPVGMASAASLPRGDREVTSVTVFDCHGRLVGGGAGRRVTLGGR